MKDVKKVEKQKSFIRQIVDVQLDFVFDVIADEFELEFGDITPHQAIALSKIGDQLTELLQEYVNQNK